MDTSVSAVGVLDKAVCVLGALEGGPRSLAEVVAATGLARATAHRLLSALEAHHLVARRDGSFVLGPALVRLGAAALAAPALAEVARGPLEALRDATGESVQLYVAQVDRRICVLSLESPHSLRTIVPLGAVLPLDRGSAGKVLRDLPEARARGWVQSVEERERGVASVSAPVRGAGGQVLAAVSVSGPVERTTRHPGRLYAAAVVEAADRVAAALRGGSALSPRP